MFAHYFGRWENYFRRWENYFGRAGWKIILAGWKIIFGGDWWWWRYVWKWKWWVWDVHEVGILMMVMVMVIDDDEDVWKWKWWVWDVHEVGVPMQLQLLPPTSSGLHQKKTTWIEKHLKIWSILNDVWRLTSKYFNNRIRKGELWTSQQSMLPKTLDFDLAFQSFFIAVFLKRKQ